MGIRFRKSINVGGGMRVNFSKTGVGFSAGNKGYRVTKMANGRIRKTASLPGTGISYVKETSSAANKTKNKNDKNANILKPNKKRNIIKKIIIIIAILFIISAISSCISNKDEKLNSIQLSDIENSLNINQTEVINVETDPENFNLNDSEFKSDNSNIAKLYFENEKLYVKTTEEGTTNVWVENDGVISNKLEVNVVDTEKQNEEINAKETDDTQEMVWISLTGNKYHSDPNCSNMNNPSEISKEDAVAKGLEPCKRCY